MPYDARFFAAPGLCGFNRAVYRLINRIILVIGGNLFYSFDFYDLCLFILGLAFLKGYKMRI